MNDGTPPHDESSRFPYLLGERVLLRIAEVGDEFALLDFHQRNDAFFRPFDPPRPKGFFTGVFWAHYVMRAREEFVQGTTCRLLVFARHKAGVLIGKVNFTQITRGPFQSCVMGYSIDQEEQGKGKMREAVEVAVDYAFGPLHLHRIAANYLPTNERSGGLLRRLGFVVEGYARDYLFINGAWRDHVLTSLTNPHWSTERER